MQKLLQLPHLMMRQFNKEVIGGSLQTVSIPFPFAHLILSINADTILSCHWSQTPSNTADTPLAHTIQSQCAQYLQDGQFRFDLPLRPPRSPFEKAYRALLADIPAGQVLTYSDAAAALNSHPRAVGQTSRHNPVLLFVPCHRIIGRNHLGGYAGSVGDDALAEKRWLLQHEGTPFDRLFHDET